MHKEKRLNVKPPHKQISDGLKTPDIKKKNYGDLEKSIGDATHNFGI